MSCIVFDPSRYGEPKGGIQLNTLRKLVESRKIDQTVTLSMLLGGREQEITGIFVESDGQLGIRVPGEPCVASDGTKYETSLLYTCTRNPLPSHEVDSDYNYEYHEYDTVFNRVKRSAAKALENIGHALYVVCVKFPYYTIGGLIGQFSSSPREWAYDCETGITWHIKNLRSAFHQSFFPSDR